MNVVESIFWLCVLLMFYAYVGYPLGMAALGKFSGRKTANFPGGEVLSVSVLLVVRNEQERLTNRIRNLLASEYERDKMEILVVSDGSDDETNRILLDIAGKHPDESKIVPVIFPKNRGKANVLPEVVGAASGEIVVFADARQEFRRDSIRRLVSPFRDSSVGAVTGQLILKKGGDEGAVGENLVTYWEYEKWLRSLESDIGTVSCVTGAIYAVRKDLFPRLPPRLLAEDLYVTLAISGQGHDILYEPGAIAYDCVQGEEIELSRKRRTLCGNYQILSLIFHGDLRLKARTLFVFFSHKAIRLFIPYLLVVIFMTSGILSVFSASIAYRIAFFLQVLFYGMAGIHFLNTAFRGFVLSRLAFAYTMMNINCVKAYQKFRKGDFAW